MLEIFSRRLVVFFEAQTGKILLDLEYQNILITNLKFQSTLIMEI